MFLDIITTLNESTGLTTLLLTMSGRSATFSRIFVVVCVSAFDINSQLRYM